MLQFTFLLGTVLVQVPLLPHFFLAARQRVNNLFLFFLDRKDLIVGDLASHKQIQQKSKNRNENKHQ